MQQKLRRYLELRRRTITGILHAAVRNTLCRNIRERYFFVLKDSVLVQFRNNARLQQLTEQVEQLQEEAQMDQSPAVVRPLSRCLCVLHSPAVLAAQRTREAAGRAAGAAENRTRAHVSTDAWKDARDRSPSVCTELSQQVCSADASSLMVAAHTEHAVLQTCLSNSHRSACGGVQRRLTA